MKNKNGLSAFGMDELIGEINNRERMTNVFPLDVFHPSLRPFIHALTHEYDLPRSYVGLSLLSSYSTAIGTAYTVTTNQKNFIYMPVWGALEGISSSGKSIVLDIIMKPLFEIQKQFDCDWEQSTNGLSAEKTKKMRLKKVIYRDAHLPTLVKDILPDNPKGLLKYTDELLEWINGMNQLGNRQQGIDEQFWISSWNCKPYSAVRSGKLTYNIPRPFVNILGGVQPSLLPKLFANDRDVTGFIFRVLFAIPEITKIAMPHPGYAMPDEYSNIHDKSITELYKNLLVYDAYSDPKMCFLSNDAIKLYLDWSSKIIHEINTIKDLTRLEVESGIFGKIKEYVLRFCALLHLSDLVLNSNKLDIVSPEFFPSKIEIAESVMERALRAGNYFYESAKTAYDVANKKTIAPPDVLLLAGLLRSGKSQPQIAAILFNDDSKAASQKVWRQIKKYSKEYPKVFGSIAK